MESSGWTKGCFFLHIKFIFMIVRCAMSECFIKCAIIIPIYKQNLNLYEMFSVRRNVDVLSSYPIIFLMSADIDEAFYMKEFPSVFIKKIDSRFFQSFQSYNRLLLSTFFYDLWREYQKILICQTDVIVLSDRLAEFVGLDYDYIGAPLVKLERDRPILYGGNGGCSLRDIQSCLLFLRKHHLEAEMWTDNEDEFFSYYGVRYSCEFKVAPVRYAAAFAFDRFSRFLYEFNNASLPFALHGWYTYDAEYAQILARKGNINDVPQVFSGNVSEKRYELQSFLQSGKYVVLYGAGIWGKALARYLKLLQINVAAFVVSDTQTIKDNKYLNIPLYHLSLLPYAADEIAVIIAVSSRAMSVGGYNSICANVKTRGITHVLYADVVLYNMAMENWLLECRDSCDNYE